MDNKEQFDKWVDQWAKAQEQGVFGESKPTQDPTGFGTLPGPDFFGVYKPTNKDLSNVDSEYWRQVYQMSAHSGEAPDVVGDEAVITEELNDEEKETLDYTKPDKKSVSKITDDLGGLSNPVKANTRGKDNINKVTPNWTCGDDLVELHNMKIKLQKLEDKLAADPMMEQKKTKSVLSQINSLKEKIDDLSNSLSPDFQTDYLS
jgi:hypothetical protein